jgi:hypothetical protein
MQQRIAELCYHPCLTTRVPPVLGLLVRYVLTFRKLPNLRAPETFNDKVLVRLLRDRNPRLAALQDKLAARDFVRSRLGGDDALPKMHAVVRRACDIDQLALPRQFAMKPNHLCDAVSLVRSGDRIDRRDLKQIAGRWLSRNYWRERWEWAYKAIPPRVLFEELLEAGGQPPEDIKFFCFDGEPRFIQVERGRSAGDFRMNFYDVEFTLLPVKKRGYPNFYPDPQRPPNLGAMLDVARALSGGIDFVRVDMYNLAGRIVFGEFTNYPGGGIGAFEPAWWDLEFGRAWKLLA